MATEQINLDGDNILDDYKENNNEFSDDEETEKETNKSNNITLIVPEIKGPEFYETLNKIKEYKRVFPNECKNVELKGDSNKHSYQDLLCKVDECKIACANRPNAQLHKIGFKALLSGMELYVAPSLKMDLKGFTNTAIADEDLMKTLDEIALMQDWSTKFIPPEQRLLIGLGTLAFRINAANQAAKKELKLPSNEANYDDL